MMFVRRESQLIHLPAVCDKCETIFQSGIVGGEGSTITISNSTSGPCPNCGSIGHIPNGTFRLIDNFIEILNAPQRTLDELTKFSELLEKNRKKEITTEELEIKTKKEVPDLQPLLDFILPRTREEKFNFGMVVLSATLHIFTSVLFNNQSTENIKPDVIINNVYEIQEYNNYHIKEPVKTEKIRRNEPCTCGDRKSVV